jgi:hypothetical protein
MQNLRKGRATFQSCPSPQTGNTAPLLISLPTKYHTPAYDGSLAICWTVTKKPHVSRDCQVYIFYKKSLKKNKCIFRRSDITQISGQHKKWRQWSSYLSHRPRVKCSNWWQNIKKHKSEAASSSMMFVSSFLMNFSVSSKLLEGKFYKNTKAHGQVASTYFAIK